jgi:hypothetical protein
MVNTHLEDKMIGKLDSVIETEKAVAEGIVKDFFGSKAETLGGVTEGQLEVINHIKSVKEV